MIPRIPWPDGKTFAFTIFDDPDSQTLEAGRAVYAFLNDLGFRTTKGVWPLRASAPPSDHGATCADPAYRAWAQGLQHGGFEIAFHNATSHTSNRAEVVRSLDEFAAMFGAAPRSYAQHYYCAENIHWGEERVTGLRRVLYNVATRGRNRNRYHGSTPGHPEFWGDVCRERIQYVRNFAFAAGDTLECCPFMPYHDPERPYVNHWFAASEGSNAQTFLERLTPAALDRLESNGGACIMYTHFAHGYYDGSDLNPRFRELMTGLARRNGWFVPVSRLLDHLLATRGRRVISPRERAALERRWLLHKLRFGTA